MELISEEKNGVLVVCVKGDIDLNSNVEFKKFVNEKIDNGCNELIIDFSGIEYIDSSGLGTLLTAKKKVSKNQGDIVLFGLSDTIKTLFKMSKLLGFFNVFENMDDALSSFQ